LYGFVNRAVELGNANMKRIDTVWSARHGRFLMFFLGLSLAGVMWNKLEDPLRQQQSADDVRSSNDRLQGEVTTTIIRIKHFKRKIEAWQAVTDANYFPWSSILSAQIAELEGDHGRGELS
jgi:hypothetical protein